MLPPRTTRRIALLAPFLGLTLTSPVAPVSAATTTVTVAGMAFTPSSVTLALGSAVNWKFSSTHTSTSNQGFWDSGNKSAGQSYLRTFVDAGSFAYHCSLHPHMTGVVRVKVKSFGTSGSGYALRWSTRTSTPSSLRYDIQVKRAGTTSWVWYRQDTKTRTATFNPTRSATYYLRVRTENIGIGHSGYSPVLTLKIT